MKLYAPWCLSNSSTTSGTGCATRDHVICESCWTLVYMWINTNDRTNHEPLTKQFRDLLSLLLTTDYDFEIGTTEKMIAELILIWTKCTEVRGVWCLTPLSTIFQLYRGGQFIGGGIWRESPTCRKSVTNVII